MRLLHTTDLTLHEFHGRNVPHYAMLSHTWDGEEVVFADLQRDPYYLSRDRQGPKTQSRDKIRSFCRIAAQQWNLDYGWVDTCCIDKSSSADLSECINSMFRWYQESARCIAFLVDVIWVVEYFTIPNWSKEAFTMSRWFTRGWTLQELIAPRHVTLYDGSWNKIGTKHEHAELISDACSVPIDLLRDRKRRSDYSVAQRMSWASKRETTREEDIAYCLWGLFDINMPLLYGEGGEKAFLRLQEEIIRQSPDESIFAWEPRHSPFGMYRGVLAEHPSEFQHARHIEASLESGHRPNPYITTHRGIQIDLALFDPKKHKEFKQHLLEHPSAAPGHFKVAQLRCFYSNDPRFITLTLRRLPSGEYYRFGWLLTSKAVLNAPMERVYIRNSRGLI